MENKSTSDRVKIKIRKELFHFFDIKLSRSWEVKQTIYDEDTQMATCIFTDLKDTNALIKDIRLVKFLNQNKTPRWYQKDAQLILTAFIKLEQILESSFVLFNKPLTGVILNPRFAQMENPLLDSLKQSTYICAKITGIPFID